MASVTCVNGHEVDLGDVPTDQGLVKWECPECQAVGDVPGTEPQPAQQPTVAADEAVNGADQARAASGTPK